MVHPLAVCSHCNLLFESHAFEMADGAAWAFQGIGTNCPRCNGDARFIDGVHRAFGNSVQVTADPNGREMLTALIGALQKAQERGASNEEIEQIIEETAPAYSGLKSLFAQKNRVELWAILALVIAYLTYLTQNPSQPPTNTTINNIITNCVQQNSDIPANRKQRRARQRKARRK